VVISIISCISSKQIHCSTEIPGTCDSYDSFSEGELFILHSSAMSEPMKIELDLKIVVLRQVQMKARSISRALRLIGSERKRTNILDSMIILFRSANGFMYEGKLEDIYAASPNTMMDNIGFLK
jgi:hypothetical protein